jgi:hypothetical protein
VIRFLYPMGGHSYLCFVNNFELVTYMCFARRVECEVAQAKLCIV